jgi:hypothetical protein
LRKFKHIEDLDKKAYMLLEFAGQKDNWEIEDPIHMPTEEYNKILQVIESGIHKCIEKIIKINKSELIKGNG